MTRKTIVIYDAEESIVCDRRQVGPNFLEEAPGVYSDLLGTCFVVVENSTSINALSQVCAKIVYRPRNPNRNSRFQGIRIERGWIVLCLNMHTMSVYNHLEESQSTLEGDQKRAHS